MHQFSHPGFESFMSFTCPGCGQLNQDVIGVPAMSDDFVTSQSINEQFQAYICGRCLQPSRLRVRNLGKRIIVQLPDFPAVQVHASEAYWADEAEAMGIAEWEIPKEPYARLIETIDDVLEIVRSPHAEFFNKTLPRMAFIQLFSALEAYLTDTLLARVLNDPERLGRMLAGVKELQAIKLSLADVLADPDVVRRTVTETVNKMSFHNLNKTDAVWNVAFGHGIFKHGEIRERLLGYVDVRHDCVHRNGKSRDGVERTEVDYGFLRDVAHYFRGTVLYIEGRLDGDDFEDGMLDAPPEH